MSGADTTAPQPNDGEIITVRPDAETLTRQRLPYFVGISGNTAGTQGISMNLVIIPPGASAEPHFHRDYETAIYILEGRVETRYGLGLRQSVINETGDFLFIPPGVPHQPHNLSQTEPARALVSRNDPNEQENVVLYNPAHHNPAGNDPAGNHPAGDDPAG
ncbi:cupin domain-containing protein [Thermoleptolyngbya sp. C42_A2020_037]|uniref:cupin domain-containing protein n=1 Tax=Thermoleptolyngbya sp. C42_A2020_037 TaxID=2747799 RepID=UPI0019DFB2AD|nr:cupin domain-containing protein [Thermoleptolyngbya sp. C42_A2020_037]